MHFVRAIFALNCRGNELISEKGSLPGDFHDDERIGNGKIGNGVMGSQDRLIISKDVMVTLVRMLKNSDPDVRSTAAATIGKLSENGTQFPPYFGVRV